MKHFYFILLLVFSTNCIAQHSQTVIKRDRNDNISFARFNIDSTKNRMDDSKVFLENLYNKTNGIDFRIINEKKDSYGILHKKYQAYYKGILIEGAELGLHGRNNSISKMNSKLFEVTPGLETNPNLSASQAKTIAITLIDAKKYAWEDKGMESFIKQRYNNIDTTYVPRGELIFTTHPHERDQEYKLAWKFQIVALEPYSADIVYVNAIDGEIIKKTSLLCSANSPGTAETLYSGTRQITSDSFSNGFRLRQTRMVYRLVPWILIKVPITPPQSILLIMIIIGQPWNMVISKLTRLLWMLIGEQNPY